MATNAQLAKAVARLAENGYLDHAGADRPACLRDALEHAGILPSEDALEREKGEYWEEVTKIIDGVVEDVRQGKVANRRLARNAVFGATTPWVLAMDPLEAAAVLRSTGYPRDYFGKDVTLPFPWVAAAMGSAERDCLAELKTRPEYAALPEGGKPVTEVPDGRRGEGG